MGLARGAAALLIEECKRRAFSGRAATLGVQTLYMTPTDLDRQFKKFDVAPSGPLQTGAGFNDKMLFKMLGFESVERIDYSDFEGAEHVVDLNADGVSPALREQFDVVVDSGTLEHVFHLPNALKNLSSLVKPGGRIILLTPSSNHLDHGFYMFSPTLFADYFLTNKFEINTAYVVRYSPDLTVLWDAYRYDPDRWRDLHIGGLDGRPYVLYFVLTKTSESTSGVIPQQNFYADTAAMYYGSRRAKDAAEGLENEQAGGWSVPVRAPSAHNERWRNIRRSVGKILRGSPLMYRLAQRLLLQIDKRHLNKELVGRY